MIINDTGSGRHFKSAGLFKRNPKLKPTTKKFYAYGQKTPLPWDFFKLLFAGRKVK